MKLPVIALALFPLLISLSCLPAPDEPVRNRVDPPPEAAEQPGETPEPAASEEVEKPAAAFALLPASVVRVTNGDTIRVLLDDSSEVAVRLIGVDTPESTQETEPFGKEAAAFTRKHLAGQTVYLELDVAKRDKFGRLLAYVWLTLPENDSEGQIRAKMFNAKLLLQGYAQVMTVAPNVKYADLFANLQREAREAQRGLWGAAPEAPARIEANYIGNAGTLKFHYPDCRWAERISPANRVEIGDRIEAIRAGYEPCKVCRP